MNRKPKRGRGHQRPPDDSLIGASEAAGILGCDRSTISRFAKLGLLKPAVVEDGDVRWFDRKWIALLAAHFTLKRAARKRRLRRAEGAVDESMFDANGDYRPELRKRRPSRTDAMSPPPSKVPTRRSQTTETPKRDVLPARRADRPTGARTQILPPEWWTMDLTQADSATETRAANSPEAAQYERQERSPSAHTQGTPSQAVPARIATVVEPSWFDEDWKPEE